MSMMIDEPAATRRSRGAALEEATREDLDAYGVEELRARMARLEGEVARTRAALDRKQAGRSAADALFNMQGG